MGLFGDKDLKRLDLEVSGLVVITEVLLRDAVPDRTRAQTGIDQTVEDIAVLVTRLRAKGKGAEADAKLAGLRSDKPEVEVELSQLRSRVQERLTQL